MFYKIIENECFKNKLEAEILKNNCAANCKYNKAH